MHSAESPVHGTDRPAGSGGDARPERRDGRSERARGRAARFLAESRDFLGRLYRKADQDNIFFLAGSIAFNVLVAIIPLILVVLGIAGLLLRSQETDPTDWLLRYVLASVPPVSQAFQDFVRETLTGFLDQTAELLSIGTLVLVWIATRLVGTLRTVLREIFDVHRDRGFLAGKLFDIQMVLGAGTLFALNVGLTVALQVITVFGFGVLGLEDGVRAVQVVYARAAALVTVWVMFLLIYRYLPARRVGWRTAVTAATFTAVLFEVMKQAFSWYVTNVASYGSTYGNLATVAVLIFWIYYTAVVFILGGEVAQVAAVRRTRRRQRERLN